MSSRIFTLGSPSEIPWSGRDDRALFVGRLSPQKGHATLLRAWALLGESAPALDIIGDGPDRGILEAEIRDSSSEPGAPAGPAELQ